VGSYKKAADGSKGGRLLSQDDNMAYAADDAQANHRYQ
jgi:hypothetical protein